MRIIEPDREQTFYQWCAVAFGVIAAIGVGVIGWQAVFPPVAYAQTATTQTADGERVSMKVRTFRVHEAVELERQPDGSHIYIVTMENGDVMRMAPDEFAKFIFNKQSERNWAEVFLNISGPWGVAWVVLGLLGQAAFTGRMIVQWLVSEKKGQSVVPVAFWWMSFIGASMLIIYFIWRKDIVGILGQSTGFFVYIRNLWLIYLPKAPKQPKITDDPGPEPELAPEEG